MTALALGPHGELYVAEQDGPKPVVSRREPDGKHGWSADVDGLNVHMIATDAGVVVASCIGKDGSLSEFDGRAKWQSKFSCAFPSTPIALARDDHDTLLVVGELYHPLTLQRFGPTGDELWKTTLAELAESQWEIAISIDAGNAVVTATAYDAGGKMAGPRHPPKHYAITTSPAGKVLSTTEPTPPVRVSQETPTTMFAIAGADDSFVAVTFGGTIAIGGKKYESTNAGKAHREMRYEMPEEVVAETDVLVTRRWAARTNT
ncbi:MAG TPA: hypothetical protein VL326_07705, partial [Kofleriaceae bacterium]|nr:hypothetical protein [Kofleriaceae bacterium]